MLGCLGVSLNRRDLHLSKPESLNALPHLLPGDLSRLRQEKQVRKDRAVNDRGKVYKHRARPFAGDPNHSRLQHLNHAFGAPPASRETGAEWKGGEPFSIPFFQVKDEVQVKG